MRGLWTVGLVAAAGGFSCASFGHDEAMPPSEAEPADAGTMDAGSAETGAGSFCAALAAKPTFCDDFDEGEFPGAWVPVTAGQGQVERTTREFWSRPRSAALQGEGNAQAFLHTRLGAAPSSELRLGFKFRPNRVDVNQRIVTVELGVVGDTAYQLRFHTRDSRASLFVTEEIPDADGGTIKNLSTLVEIAAGEWTEVGLRITFGGDASTLNVKIDGGPDETATSLAAHHHLAPPTVVLGDSRTYYGVALATHFDDVFVDVK
jgi:hypothetical protein